MTNKLQLILAFVLCIFGMAVIAWACATPPKGEIHTSVLVAYGETLTFVGSLLGIDYHYRYRDRS